MKRSGAFCLITKIASSLALLLLILFLVIDLQTTVHVALSLSLIQMLPPGNGVPLPRAYVTTIHLFREV